MDGQITEEKEDVQTIIEIQTDGQTIAKEINEKNIRKIQNKHRNLEEEQDNVQTAADADEENIVELDLAYAITIHKSQGSEFSVVIIPVLTQHFKMLYRNLIYTGLTRAKKLAVFVGTHIT